MKRNYSNKNFHANARTLKVYIEKKSGRFNVREEMHLVKKKKLIILFIQTVKDFRIVSCFFTSNSVVQNI